MQIQFSSSDQRHSGRNLHSRNDSKQERVEHIERFWQQKLQRE